MTLRLDCNAATPAGVKAPPRGQVPGHLQVQPERDPRPCPGARQTSRGSMSNWLYLIGSFCFVAGTLLNMADFNHGALKDAMRCRTGFPTLQHFQQRDQ